MTIRAEMSETLDGEYIVRDRNGYTVVLTAEEIRALYAALPEKESLRPT